jgi:hypothetical protein
VNDVKVICSLCGHEQNVQQMCENYVMCMGEYLCSTCSFLMMRLVYFTLLLQQMHKW